MKRGHPSILLIFTILFVLCGQAIAAPFLSCSDSFQLATETAEEHCARMMVQIAAGHDAPAMNGMDMMSTPASTSVSSADQANYQMTDYCAFMCQYGRCASTFAIAVPVALSSPLVLSWSGLNLILSFAVQPPSDHFRPPTIA